MAVGMFILSQKQRQTLSTIFIILNIFQIIVGCGMTGSSLYIIIAVAPILHQEKSEINFVFAVTGLYGTHVFFHWIVGINISQKCLKNAGRKSTSNIFLLWSCLGTGTILQLLILSHFARKMNKYIARSIKQSISTGMSQYLQDVSWKESIDKLQYNNECCGLGSFEDWHETKWLTKYHVDIKSAVVKQFRTNDEILTLPVVPWSCCKVDFPMQCLHDPIQQEDYTHLWVDEPTVVTDSINTKGCLNLIRKPITWVINLFVTFVSILCIVHIMIFVMSRLLYTSSRNAILLGEPEGMAPGWIFGRGDCGYTGGKTVLEIMESSPKYLNKSEFTEDESEDTNRTKKISKLNIKNRLFKKKNTSRKSRDDSEISEDSKTVAAIEKKSKTIEKGLRSSTPIKEVNVNETKIMKVNEKKSKTSEESLKTVNKDEKMKPKNVYDEKMTETQKSPSSPTPKRKTETESVSNTPKKVVDKKLDTLRDKNKVNASAKSTKIPRNERDTGTRSMEEKLKRLQQ